VTDELLCFIQVNLDKTPYNNLTTVITGFYTDEEIVYSKTVIYKLISDMQIDMQGQSVPPRNKICKAGDNKKKLDTEDIMAAYSWSDSVGAQLPTFAARKLHRIPTIKPGDADICALTSSVSVLQMEMSEVLQKLQEMNDNSTRQIAGAVVNSANLDVEWPAMPFPAMSSTGSKVCHDLPTVDSVATDNWKNVAVSCVNDPTAFVNSGTKHSVTYKPVKFMGKKVTDIKAKVQPAPRRLTAFVGRLHIDTSEEDLHECLSAVGIEDVKCKKLAAKDGKVFKTAAFMVSCNAKSRDVFYDESVWPSGCKLRDWVFYENKTHGDQ